MTKLEKKLKASIRRLGIGTNSPVIIAVSGGADSTALLDAFVRSRERDGLSKTIIPAHLNHMLRGDESDGDEKFVTELAGRSGLTCLVERINVADQSIEDRQNLEATARRIRYDFLRRVAESCGAEMVLTAHTQDDQTETILMRLIRGSGPEGLRGIHQIRNLGHQVKLIRPMLGITREEVILHCDHYGIAFRTDTSNLSIDFTRNRVRRELLPMLRTFNPRIDETLIRTSELITDDQDYLHQIASESYPQVDPESKLEIQSLKQSHPAIRRRIIRTWLNATRGGLQRIDTSHLFAIEKLIAQSQSGRSVDLPGGWRVTREFHRLALSHSYSPVPCVTQVRLNQETDCAFGGFIFTLRSNVPRESLITIEPNDLDSYIAILRECKELNKMELRTRKSGDCYIPVGKHHRIKLKTLMIRHKIARSERAAYPVLVSADDEIIWSPGLPVAKYFAVCENDHEDTRYVVVIAEKIRSS